MALISCYSSLLRGINTRPVCSSTRSFEFQIARALSYNSRNTLFRYSQRNNKIYNSDFLRTDRFKRWLSRKTELTENTYNEEGEAEMTIKPSVKLANGKLTVKNRTVLTGVPNEVISTSGLDSGKADGLFLGATLDEENCRHVIRLGTLRSVRFVACFRFKLWWMAQKTGQNGSEIPLETQFLLVNAGDGINAVFLPLLEGSFRASLQGNADDDGLEICIESGDSAIKASSFERAVYVHFGPDPFEAVSEAVTAVQRRLRTFRRREEKWVPGIADVFGWCTWDAFYQDVTREGVEAGLRSLAEGGSPARFVIIDDGWQSVAPDHETDAGIDRLTGIQENSKFREPAKGGAGIESLVEVAKKKLGVKYVYVWHAIIGYWGGVRPGVGGFGAETRRVSVSEGVISNEPTWKTDKMAAEEGLGLVDPKRVHEFYEELHSYLARAGVDGVKVDVQCILETLGSGLGGRVELTRRYHQALDASVAKNFTDNGCIACMSHNTDALYCSKQTAIVRASDDFYPRDEMSHTIHVASVAYNSLFLGEFMQPDWDMFHSLHPAADYHASARAISGGPIYVSDAPGKHDFKLLKKLVLPDGTVLRPRLPGRPTQDCLFSDPTRDGVSLLKIWNMNKHTGVLGVYNCQGAAWSASEKKNAFHAPSVEEAIAGHISGRDVHLISEAAMGPGWDGDCAVHRFNSGKLSVLRRDDTLSLSLGVLEHETFTVSPVHTVAPGIRFAPLGLVGMYNSGGAIDGLSYEGSAVRMEVKGCGVFGAYSSVEPRRCVVDSRSVDFDYDLGSGMVTFDLGNLPKEGQLHDVKVDL